MDGFNNLPPVARSPPRRTLHPTPLSRFTTLVLSLPFLEDLEVRGRDRFISDMHGN